MAVGERRHFERLPCCRQLVLPVIGSNMCVRNCWHHLCCCLQSAAAGSAVTDDVFWFARQVRSLLQFTALLAHAFAAVLSAVKWSHTCMHANCPLMSRCQMSRQGGLYIGADKCSLLSPLYCLQAKDQLRYNLLKISMVKRLLRSSLWPQDINK